MKTELFNQSGEIIGNVELPDRVFGVAMNAELVKQVIDAQTANSRQVIAHTKDRSEVRGGGRKPWRQKGTGRARHASIRSPIWKGGGVAFGPTKERNFEKKINKKMKRRALFMALSSKVKDKELMIVDSLKTTEAPNGLEKPRTKIAMAIFEMLSNKLEGYKKSKKKRDSVLLVLPGQDKTTARAVKNLPFIETLSADSLNVKDVLARKYTILLKEAILVIEKTFRL